MAGGGLAALAVLLVVPSGGRASSPAGSASASSFLFRVSVGDRRAAVGSDAADALLGARPAASARLTAGSAGSSDVGSTERKASIEDAGGRTPVATGGPVSIDGLLSLDGADGSVTARVAGGSVSSEVSVALGPARLLGGLAVIGGGTSVTRTRVTRSGAETTRIIEIDGIRLLALGDLLEAIGAGRLDLSCHSVEQVGALIGVPAGDACEDLAAATDGIADAIEALAGAPGELALARDQLAAQRDAVNAQIDGIQQSIGGLEAQRGSLAQTGAALAAQRGSLAQTRAALEAQRASLVTQTGGHVRGDASADHATVAGLCQGLGAIETLTCQSTAMLTTLPALAAEYGVALPATFTDARAALLAAIDAVLALFDQIDAVDAQLAANAAQIDAVNAQLGANAAQIAGVDVQIDAAQGDLAALQEDLDGLLEARDDVLGGLALVAAHPGDAGATCDAASGALATTSDLVPSLRAAFDPVESTLRAACGGLSAAVDAIMETPLLSLDAVRISLTSTAGDGTAGIAVEGSVGRVTVGGLAPVAVDLSVMGGAVPAIRSAIGGLLAKVSRAVGLRLPVPELEFLATESQTGRGDDGFSTARGSVTALRVHVPTAAILVPAEPPLGVLGSGRPSAASVRAAGVQPAPDITLDLGVFDATSRFRAASVSPPGEPALDGAPGPGETVAPAPGGSGSTGAPGRGPLPVTGVGLGWSAAGALALCAAAAVRRFVLR